MPNTFFSFKQFTVHQDKAAMKVCTDACLFGGWSAQMLKQRFPDAKNILDIGTGTGLLSLMLAQQSEATIDAVEINKAAYEQANNNFITSPWRNKLHAIHASVNELKKNEVYDFIISNPPFYEDDLRSPDKSRTTAMHDTELTLDQLLAAIDLHLAPDGYATVLLPFLRTGFFETMGLRKGFHINERAYVRQTPSHHFFRAMLLISRDPSYAHQEEEITIHDENRKYTNEFTHFLDPYYLNIGK